MGDDGGAVSIVGNKQVPATKVITLVLVLAAVPDAQKKKKRKTEKIIRIHRCQHP